MISVVMPFHNSAPTVAEAIESILEQSCSDWELLAVDDGSTDGSGEILSGYAGLDPRIRLLQPGRVGLVRALMLGAEAARGEFLARMDADDVSAPDRLERQMAFMRDRPEVALCGGRVEDIGWPGADTQIGEGRRRYSAWLNEMASHEDIVRGLFVECPLAHPAFFLRRSVFQEVGGYQDYGWPEDYDLVLRIWRGGWDFGNVPGPPVLQWRDSPSRLSRTDPRYSLERFRACKFHHLIKSNLLPPDRGITQWGAGQEGKSWLKLWPQDRRPGRVVDIDPAKIGKVIHGARVIPPDELGPPDGSLLVAAVGAAGARHQIRHWLTERGWLEMQDFVCVA